jgi:hypothetical protein
VEEEVDVSSSSNTASFTFTLDSEEQAGIAFFVSVGSDWGKICVDDVSIAGPE